MSVLSPVARCRVSLSLGWSARARQSAAAISRGIAHTGSDTNSNRIKPSPLSFSTMSTAAASYAPPQFDFPRAPNADVKSDTQQYGLSHTMIRIKDPKASLNFYIDILGMTLVHVMHSEGGRFSNYFLLYPQSPVPSDAAERRTWLWSQQGIIELCHNWETEIGNEFKGYKSGNEAEHKGFGHLCIFVDDLQKSVDRFTSLGVAFKKRPEEGSMRDIAFIMDPDGYWVEVIKRGGSARL